MNFAHRARILRKSAFRRYYGDAHGLAEPSLSLSFVSYTGEASFSNERTGRGQSDQELERITGTGSGQWSCSRRGDRQEPNVPVSDTKLRKRQSNAAW